MNETKSLTGRQKFTLVKRWFRQPVLALQVEVRHTGMEPYNMGNSVEMEPYDFCTWEFAEVGDLQQLGGTSQ